MPPTACTQGRRGGGAPFAVALLALLAVAAAADGDDAAATAATAAAPAAAAATIAPAAAAAPLDLPAGTTTFTLDLSTPPASSPYLEASSNLRLVPGGAGYKLASAFVRPPSYAAGVVAAYPFDSLVNGSAPPAAGHVTLRAASASLPAGGAGQPPDAWIVGTSDGAPLADAGKYGRAVKLLPGSQQWLQIHGAPLREEALGAAGGVSVALWYKPSAPAPAGRLVERMYDNFDINIGGGSGATNLECSIRDTSGRFYSAFQVVGSLNTSRWHHIACAYDPQTKALSLYLNGAPLANTTAPDCTGRFQHGDNMPIGVGNRAGAAGDLGQYADASVPAGLVDDLVIWARPLAASEVAAIYASKVPVAPVAAAGTAWAASRALRRVGPGREAAAFVARWALAPGSGAGGGAPDEGAVTVQLSTDRGATWCDAANGQPLTDQFRGGPALMCLFPAVTLSFRIAWRSEATLASFSVAFLPEAPGAPPRPSVLVGMNLGGFAYYSSFSPFADIFRIAGNDNTVPPISGEDSNGYPLAIKPEDQCPSCGFWVPGLYLWGQNPDNHPPGTYTVEITGRGLVSFEGDAGRFVIDTTSAANNSAVATRAITIPNSTDVGVWTRIAAGAPGGGRVTKIRVLMPGVPQQGPGAGAFNEAFLSTLRGFKLFRTMDWQHTNNQNLAQWADRATPTTVSQDRKIVRAFRITRAEVVPASSAPPFMHGAPTVRVTTLSPHGLVTGQVVGMSGTDGRLVTTAGKARGFDTPGAAAFVVSSRVFYYTPKDWSWAAAEGVAMSAPAARGNATLVVRPGVAFELVAEMARTIGSDPWVNVPHLATDDFVNKMAAWWASHLPPGRRLYVEYSNEVWNWMFGQTEYASRMAAQNGMYADGYPQHLRWYARRTAAIHALFRKAFTAKGLPTAGPAARLVCVVGAQAGSGADELGEMRALGQLPDALAIAPYFGSSLNQEIFDAGPANFDLDQVLDLARAKVVADTLKRTQGSKSIADAHGVPRLVAYEGGQHLGGGGGCAPSGCENVEPLQRLFVAANRDERMFGLYDNMLRAWAAAGGAEFAAYAHITGFGKWGSWGALERQGQDPATAPKYRALRLYAPAP